MSLARSHPKRLMLCASAMLLAGPIVSFVVYRTRADERQTATPRLDNTHLALARLDTAQADVYGVKLANSPTSSPASAGLRHAEATPAAMHPAASAAQAGCCKDRGMKEGELPVTTDARTTSQDPEEKTGLPIGHLAPAFTLTDQNDQQISLESLLKKGPVAVVFHRSIGWCLYCKLQMIQLQRIQREIEAVGGQLVAISYDSPETIKGYAERHKITFPLLSDVGSKTIDAYDIRYKEAPPETTGFARHATFILDQNGIIRTKLFQLSFQERSAVDNLINALKEARKAKGETKS